MDSSHLHRIDVTNETKLRVRVTPIKQAVRATLEAHYPQAAEVYVLLTGDEHMSQLNRQYRNIDQSTDVLSFPGGDFPNAPLGDIAISIPYAQRQAQERQATLESEILYLAIHGCLHLLGWDDETDVDRKKMVTEMLRIGASIGLAADPYWQSLLESER